MCDRALRLAVAAVALAGTAVAGYLTYVHYRPAALICTGGGGCEAVQDSSYAEMAGIPVAVLGLKVHVLTPGTTFDLNSRTASAASLIPTR